MKTNSKSLSIRIDTAYYPNRWGIDPGTRPDKFEVTVKDRPIRVAFITENDSIVRDIKRGDVVNFIVLTAAGDSAYTQIYGWPYIAPAVFNKAYQDKTKGKTFVEIPEMYELVNTAFALTKATQKKESGLIEKGTPYYKELMTYFAAYQQEPIVSIMDSILTKDESAYHPLKMEAYSFEINRAGKILHSQVYNRTSWGKENMLRPYLAQLQQFATKSKFTEFYRKHQPYYDQLIRAYRDSLDVAGMQKWLNGNFPSTHYDAFKIIFSPLVSANQSANWLEDNGFKEAHAHINFPFPGKSDADFSVKAVNVRKGNIVFTELNHAFINPEADKYTAQLKKAVPDLSIWLTEGKPGRQYYNNIYSCFNEYMNWGLVSLRYVDLVPADELPMMQKRVEGQMVNYRGFSKFAEFNQFLVSIYKARPVGTTVADLYPQIIQWFASQKQ
ncbi:DUF4932 domain-containing protein [Spirosoma daeguense]